MTDYNGLPLWDEEGGTGPENWPMLSPGLLADLEEWERYWSQHHHHMRGWQMGTRDWYVEEGHRLAARLREELGSDWTVQLILD